MTAPAVDSLTKSARDDLMDTPVRIGAVNYLNTKPLICDLEELAPGARLLLDVPSRLADLLAEGRLDVALIPVIEYFRAGTYSAVPGLSIASNGPVLSVTLFSRAPWAGIRRVALDAGSRTSAALAQVLLRKRYGVRPEVVPLPLDRAAEDADADAVLLIGDRAMRACLPSFDYAFDLGEEWQHWTGLPFVYAVWAVRPGMDQGLVGEALTEGKRRGLRRLGVIAEREAPGRGLDAGFCRRYLTHALHYGLGTREQAGMKRFGALATELGLVRRSAGLALHRDPALHEAARV